LQPVDTVPQALRDGTARLSNRVGIQKALRIVFSMAQRGYAWIKAGNSTFARSSALDVMLSSERSDAMRAPLPRHRARWLVTAQPGFILTVIGHRHFSAT